MINFSIDYLTRKDSGTEGDDSPRSSPTLSKMRPSSSSFSDSSSGESGDSVSPSSRTSPGVVQGSSKSSSDKPSLSYIALISMAILDCPEKKALLGDIYQYIMDSFPYYNNKEKAWRNSIRHNLSLNECFIKSGRADNGKGNYWSIHPACVDDFSQGDFRRRQARRRARKSTMPEMSVSELPMSYRCNLGYVPMTTSALPNSTMNSAMYYPTATYNTANTMTPALGYPSFSGPATMGYSHPSNNVVCYQNILNGSQNTSW